MTDYALVEASSETATIVVAIVCERSAVALRQLRSSAPKA